MGELKMEIIGGKNIKKVAFGNKKGLFKKFFKFLR
jgi:hypothetical protein